MGKEADRMVRQLAAMLANKWNKPYYVVCHFVRSRVKIAVIRSASKCLRGSRVPARAMSFERQCWKDGSGLGPEWIGW